MNKKPWNPIEMLLGNIFSDDNKSEELSVIDFLKATPFFKRLSHRQIKKVMQVLHAREFAVNEFLFEFGNPGAALFFIQSGEVSIEVPTESGVNQVASLSEKTFLGEIALLHDDERTANARAIKKTKCLALYRNDLLRLSETEPEITTEIYRSVASVVAKRLVVTTKVISEQKKQLDNRKLEAA